MRLASASSHECIPSDYADANRRYAGWPHAHFDALPGATLLDLGDLEDALINLLGIDVDLRTPGDLPPKFRAEVLAEAQPV